MTRRNDVSHPPEQAERADAAQAGSSVSQRMPGGATARSCGVCGGQIDAARYVCRLCTSTLISDLALWVGDGDLVDLPRQTIAWSLPAELTTTAVRQSRMTAPGSGGRIVHRDDERPLPYDDRAATALREDAIWLRDSTRTFGASQRVLASQQAGTWGRWLLRHVERIARHVDGAAFATEARRRTARALRIIDRPPPLWYAGRCASCTADLYAAEGAPVVTCASCDARYDVAVQRERLMAAVEDRLATASEISRAVHLLDRPVSRSVIDHWVSRGLLLRRGHNAAGHHMYRIGDVLTLVARDPRPDRRRAS